MEQFANDGRPRRREYSKAFKAQILNECAQPGASVGGAALSHGLHANMVHRWLRETRQAQTFTAHLSADAPAAFVALPLSESLPSATSPAPVVSTPVQVRLQRGDLVVSLSCTVSDCGAGLWSGAPAPRLLADLKHKQALLLSIIVYPLATSNLRDPAGIHVLSWQSEGPRAQLRHTKCRHRHAHDRQRQG